MTNTQRQPAATPSPDFEARTRLKVEVFHEVRNQEKTVSDVEERVQSVLNTHGERVTDIRIAVGHRASAIFLTLQKKRWASDSLEQLARETANWLDYSQYADDVTVRKWYIDTETKRGEA